MMSLAEQLTKESYQMPAQRFTVIDEGTASTIDAKAEKGRLLVSAGDLKEAFGWELRPEGLCRGTMCISTAGTRLVADNRIDLAVLADTLDRPLAIDFDNQAAYLGAVAQERADALASLVAPDFTLPDLDGQMHSLSDYRGLKILLVAYASW